MTYANGAILGILIWVFLRAIGRLSSAERFQIWLLYLVGLVAFHLLLFPRSVYSRLLPMLRSHALQGPSHPNLISIGSCRQCWLPGSCFGNLQRGECGLERAELDRFGIVTRESPRPPAPGEFYCLGTLRSGRRNACRMSWLHEQAHLSR